MYQSSSELQKYCSSYKPYSKDRLSNKDIRLKELVDIIEENNKNICEKRDSNIVISLSYLLYQKRNPENEFTNVARSLHNNIIKNEERENNIINIKMLYEFNERPENKFSIIISATPDILEVRKNTLYVREVTTTVINLENNIEIKLNYLFLDKENLESKLKIKKNQSLSYSYILNQIIQEKIIGINKIRYTVEDYIILPDEEKYEIMEKLKIGNYIRKNKDSIYKSIKDNIEFKIMEYNNYIIGNNSKKYYIFGKVVISNELDKQKEEDIKRLLSNRVEKLNIYKDFQYKG
ncbi:hypothetical protein YN1_1260 [Nanoarchaeota archaeon]